MSGYEVDGANFSTLEGFYDVVSRVLVPHAVWGRDLNALNDILHGGFGTPEVGFTLGLTHELSRERLGYAETVRQLRLSLERCHPTARDQAQGDLDRAETWSRPTVFDWLVEIIDGHPTGFPPRGTVTLILA